MRQAGVRLRHSKPQLFRGFENIGEEAGFLWAVLGGDDPGHVLWAPYVFDMAKDFGLVLLEDGTLIDTGRGEAVPEGARIMPVTSREQIDMLTRVDSAALEHCVIRHGAARPAGLFAGSAGLVDRLLIGAEPIAWPHGFTVSEVSLAAGTFLSDHTLDVADVWFIQQGNVEVTLGPQATVCGAGDTITVPRGSVRSLRNTGDKQAIVVQVRGGDALPRPAWP